MDGTSKYVNLKSGPEVGGMPTGSLVGDILQWDGHYWVPVQPDSISPDIRSSHASATANVNCDLIWDMAFAGTDYTFVINGINLKGKPVEITIVSKLNTKLVIKTIEGASITAIAKPY
ncbi:MAG: hypothetical protein WCO44_12350 [Bacteroidota bacterium]